MKTWIFSVSIALAMALVFAVIACSPQSRNNQFDPGGTAYTGGTNSSTNSTNTTGTNATNSFLATWSGKAIVVTPPSSLWNRKSTVSWPPATNITSYSVFISTSALKPTTPSASNLTQTNALIDFAGVGVNNLWVEATTTNAGATNIVLTTNYKVLSGWSMDNSMGSPSAPALRCVNVPQGQFRTINFSNQLTVGMPNPWTFFSNQMRHTNWTLGVNLQYWINFFTNGFLCTTTTYDGTAMIEDAWNPISRTVGQFPIQTTNWYRFQIVVSNGGDSDGFNAFWIDSLNFNSAGQVFYNDLSGYDNSKISGDLEN